MPEVKEVRMTPMHQTKVTKFNVVKSDSNSIETLFKYIELKLKESKAFENSSLADLAK